MLFATASVFAVVGHTTCVEAYRPISRVTCVRVFCPQKMTPNWMIPPTINIKTGNTSANSARLWPRDRFRDGRVRVRWKVMDTPKVLAGMTEVLAIVPD
jgi:hypothetical protein